MSHPPKALGARTLLSVFRGVRLGTALTCLVLACPPTVAAGPVAKNIVLITVDTLRADHVNASLTPHIEQLARDSIVFERTISPAPLTLPAHASILTGQYPPAHGVRDNLLFRLPQGTPTLATLLRARGYSTAAFVSSVVLDARFGLDQGFDVYDDRIQGPERPAWDTLESASKWLATAKRPFFVWVHLFEPHAPYRGGYEEEIRTVDRQLGLFFGRLREMGIEGESLVCIASDHGESLGEHGEKTHGLFVYDATLAVPWILHVPGQSPRRVPEQVRLIDLAPTLLQYVGIGWGGDASPDPPVQGEGLRGALERGGFEGFDSYSETYLPLHQFGWSPLKSLLTPRYAYIRAPQPELYDRIADPEERNNLAEGKRAMAAALEERLKSLERRYGGSSPASKAGLLLADRFLSLGYIGYAPGTASDEDVPLSDPKDKVGLYNLVMNALELSEGGKPDEALELLRRVEAEDPDITVVHYLKGSIEGGRGRYAAAAQALEVALRLNPKHLAARFRLAQARLSLQEYDQAAIELRRVLDDDPRNVRALHNLAVVAYVRGDLSEAEASEKKAIAIEPDYFEAWNTLGAIHLRRREYSRATDCLLKAIGLNPGSGQAFFNLSLAEQAGGDQDAARRHRERACVLDPALCGSR